MYALNMSKTETARPNLCEFSLRNERLAVRQSQGVALHVRVEMIFRENYNSK